MRPVSWSLVRRNVLCGALIGLTSILTFTAVSSAATLTVRTGNAALGQPDPLIRYLIEPSGLCGAGFPSAFTPVDFAAAAAGPNAFTFAGFAPPWTPSLACDPLAQWITPFSDLSARSALFAQEFVVAEPCCIHQATLTFCWAQDDWLGDLDSFINPGVFLNGIALPISGGSYASETSAVVDVTGNLHCGVNTLYVYDRDAGCAVSGLIYSATFQIDECSVSVDPGSWGRVKSLYK